MINLHWLYVVAGIVFASFAVSSARERRWANTAFWGLIAVSFWFGDFLGDIGNGALVLALVALAGAHLLRKGTRPSTSDEEREGYSGKLGNRLFLPALVIPFTAFAGTLLFNYTPLKTAGLIDPKSVTLILLGLGAIVALATCYAW